MNITFEDLLNAAGAVVAAGIVTTLVQLIKAVLPTLDARVSGALMAFVLSGILYVLAAVQVGVADLNGGLNVFLAWLACATAAVGIKSTVDHVRTVS
jgi:hypothetical protein